MVWFAAFPPRPLYTHTYTHTSEFQIYVDWEGQGLREREGRRLEQGVGSKQGVGKEVRSSGGWDGRSTPAAEEGGRREGKRVCMRVCVREEPEDTCSNTPHTRTYTAHNHPSC